MMAPDDVTVEDPLLAALDEAGFCAGAAESAAGVLDRCGRMLPEWKPYNDGRAPMTFIQKAKMGGPEDESAMTKFAVKVLGK